MDLSLTSVFYSNYSNLLFIIFQLFIILASFICYKKKKGFFSVLLILIMYFLFSIYLIWEYYDAYTELTKYYTHSGVIPLPNVLLGIAQTEAFYIITAIINLMGFILVVKVLRKDTS